MITKLDNWSQDASEGDAELYPDYPPKKDEI